MCYGKDNRAEYNHRLPGYELACGCRLGYYLCQQAEYLWRQATGLYDAYMIGKATWSEYRTAMERYCQHYAEVVEEG